MDEEEFRIKASRYDTSAGPSTSCMADERSTAASSVSRSKDAYAEKTFKSPDELPGEYLKYQTEFTRQHVAVAVARDMTDL